MAGSRKNDNRSSDRRYMRFNQVAARDLENYDNGSRRLTEVPADGAIVVRGGWQMSGRRFSPGLIAGHRLAIVIGIAVLVMECAQCQRTVVTYVGRARVDVTVPYAS